MISISGHKRQCTGASICQCYCLAVKSFYCSYLTLATLADFSLKLPLLFCFSSLSLCKVQPSKQLDLIVPTAKIFLEANSINKFNDVYQLSKHKTEFMLDSTTCNSLKNYIGSCTKIR